MVVILDPENAEPTARLESSHRPCPEAAAGSGRPLGICSELGVSRS